MRRRTLTTLVVVSGLLGYAAADLFDVVPGVVTISAPAVYASPTASARGSAHLPVPTPPPSGMPVSPAAGQAPLPSAAGVKAAVSAALADPDLAGAAVLVEDAATGATLLENAATAPRIPASTLKLVAALAVQQEFPAGSTLSTRVVQGGTPNEVVLVAGGDMFLAPDRGDPAAVVGRAGLGDLADQVSARLKSRGITSATVSVNTRYAPGPQEAAGWRPDYRRLGIVGPVAMLGLSSQWAQSGQPGPADPVAEVAKAFGARLTERGVAASVAAVPSGAGAASGSAPAGPRAGAGPTETGAGSSQTGAGRTVVPEGTELGVVTSAPVTDLVGLALERSDNTLTESLARQAAFRAGRSSDFEGTAAYLRDSLARAGLDSAGVSLHDASGLSRTNLLTAHVLADVLALGVHGRLPGLTEALRHLPVAGLTGTLEQRYTASGQAPGAGVVRAKTGSLNGVNSLAGIVVTAEGRLLIFVILQQGPVGTAEARDALDRFGATLAACGCR